LLLSAFILSACATQVPVHESLPAAARDNIASADVVVPIKQSEIYVFVPNSQIAAAGGGGLLLALVDAGVDSVRTSKAEAAVKPLRDAIVDYNFDQTLQSEIQTSLASDPWLHPDHARVIKELANDRLDKVLMDSKDTAVLFATADYQLSNNALELTITMTASLFPNSDALNALKQRAKSGPRSSVVNALYHNTLTFTADVPNATADRDRNIATWSANNGAVMRATLTKGARELARMLASDLQGPEADTALNNDPDGAIMRSGDGTLRASARPAP
jgi:hypothetical protein